MDGGTIAAFLAGLAALTTAVGGVVVQLRRTDPTNVKVLQDRASAAEGEVVTLRAELLELRREVHALRGVLADHGWTAPVPTPGGPS